MKQETGSAITIARAVDGDRAGIGQVHVASWRDAYADVLPADYLGTQIEDRMNAHWSSKVFGEGDVVLVARRGERVVGFAATWAEVPPLLDNLHILPGLRRYGLGQRLIRKTAKVLRDSGRDRLALWVLSDNAGARRFYARLGGVEGRRKMRRLGTTQAENIAVTWDSLDPILD